MSLTRRTPQQRRRRTARVALLGIAALAGAAALAARIPPAPVRWPQPAAPRAVGSWHLHGTDSHDSNVPPAAWAAAAATRGLNFVVLTDHDTQTHRPYAVGAVQVLPQAELTTPAGHVVGLGAEVAPLPAERHDPALLAKLRARGVLGIAAHPKSPKRPWVGGPAYLAGVEPANFSASMDRLLRTPGQWGTLLVSLLAYPLAPEAAMAPLYARDAAAVAFWDTLPPPALGLCGGDGHGWIDLGRNLSAWHVVLDDVPAPPAGEAVAADVVLASLRRGHAHSVAGLWQREVGFSFVALRRGDVVAQEGDEAPADTEVLRACTGPLRPDGTDTFRLRLFHDGALAAESDAQCVSLVRPKPGAWRVEGVAALPRLPGGRTLTTVLYSNRIHLPAAAAAAAAPAAPAPQ